VTSDENKAKPLVGAATSGPQSAKANEPKHAPTPIDPLLLFDFEQDTEGFQVNDTKQWGIVDAAMVATTEGGAHGARALRVYSPRDSWVGHEFETPQDWTKYQSLTFALRSAQGFSGKIAVKSGNDWDWCEARAQRIGEMGDFGVYRIQLVSKVCPTIRRDVVHGVHLWLGADDTFILDDFRFETAP
jgi:hypothetical protein